MFLNIELIIELIIEYLPFVKYFLIYCCRHSLKQNSKKKQSWSRKLNLILAFIRFSSRIVLFIDKINSRQVAIRTSLEVVALGKIFRIFRVCKCQEVYCNKYNCTFHVLAAIRYHLELSFSRRLLLATMYIQYRDEFEKRT